VRESTYVVHIRMPYRSTKASPAGEPDAAAADERAQASRESAAPRTNARPEGQAFADGNSGGSRG